MREVARRQLSRRIASGAKAHLGCGSNYFQGWVNVDLERANRPDVKHDLRLGFPCTRGVIAVAYSEHVLEHIVLEDGIRLLSDLRVGMTPGGVIRIAMPDLRYVVDRYGNGWRDQDWIQQPHYSFIDSPARMLNYALRSWGHRYVYDFDELTLRLVNAGFRDVIAKPWGESDHPDLRGRETREDSKLIVEAVAP
jgi:predicted SAM-dependent methyltransferase